MSFVKVSVLIPCFNAEAYVAAAIESALAQTYDNIEVIVVDDGSTDNSADVVARYANRGVRLVRQQNRGQCVAANRAFAEATGDLIKFFDADDVMAAEMVERQVGRLGSRRDAVAMGEWTRFTGDNPFKSEFKRLPMYRDAAPADWLSREWVNAQPMMQCALWLISRQILERSGLWDERLTLINDFEFIARVLTKADEILYSPGARLYYRSGLAESLSGRKDRESLESAFLSISLGTRHLLNKEDSPQTRRACANIFQNFEYENYPFHADLRAKARKRVSEFGGADIVPVGPPGFHTLRRFMGWRLARRAQHAAERLGLNRASRKASTAQRIDAHRTDR
ncbi:MAG: glycosyltransferase family 2 protein [bacterium]|nr:glycosyltransferase family 2 protein [bacterium]